MIRGEELVTNANRAFWLQMTKESTIPYCLEMLKLSYDYCHYANSALKMAEIMGYMDFLVRKTDNGERAEVKQEESPFPSDLLGFIHEFDGNGRFEPAHLMCKMGILRDEGSNINYEFLIEYDIFHPDVEIYYGVKAVSDSLFTSPEFQQKVIADWQNVRSAKKYVSLANKFKITNNGDNGTFWPFWLRLNADGKNSLIDAVRHLSMFYDDYRRNLSLSEVISPRFSEVNENLLKWRQTPEDYDRLLGVVGKRFGMEGRKKFEKVFIGNCLKQGYIAESGERSYYVTGIPNYKFTYLARIFFLGLSYLYGEGQIPQKELTKVFLGRKKTYLTASDWGKSENDMRDEWERCEQEVKDWIGINAK